MYGDQHRRLHSADADITCSSSTTSLGTPGSTRCGKKVVFRKKTGQHVRCLRSDGGKEYFPDDFTALSCLSNLDSFIYYTYFKSDIGFLHISRSVWTRLRQRFVDDRVFSDWEPSFFSSIIVLYRCSLQALEGCLFFVESTSASGRGSITCWLCVSGR